MKAFLILACVALAVSSVTGEDSKDQTPPSLTVKKHLDAYKRPLVEHVLDGRKTIETRLYSRRDKLTLKDGTETLFFDHETYEFSGGNLKQFTEDETTREKKEVPGDMRQYKAARREFLYNFTYDLRRADLSAENIGIAGRIPGYTFYSPEEIKIIESLKRAIIDKSVDRVKEILDAHPKLVNAIHPPEPIDRGYDPTPLHQAVLYDCLPIVELLLARGADPNLESNQGLPLHSAVCKMDILKCLVAAKADIHALNSHGCSPLEIALGANRLAEAKYLLSHGTKMTLNAAAGLGDLNQIRLMYEKNKKKDSHRFTPLDYAAACGQVEAAALLVELGADINPLNDEYFDGTPLLTATYHRQKEMVEWLLEHGADLHKSPIGETPLHIAARNNDTDTAALFIKHKANVNAIVRPTGATPLHYAAEYGCLDTAKLLIANGADTNARQDRTGPVNPPPEPIIESVLDTAIRGGNKAIVKLLMANSANLNKASREELEELLKSPDK